MNRFLGLCALALLLAGCSDNAPDGDAQIIHKPKTGCPTGYTLAVAAFLERDGSSLDACVSNTRKKYSIDVLNPGESCCHSQKSPPAATPTPEPSDKQKIALLRAEAHNRHLRWKVWCADLGPDWQFQGWAVPPGDDWGVYIEEGARPDWNAHGTTEAEAAYNLYIEIQQPPNGEPRHDPSRHNGQKKHCPPELHGD